MVRRSPPRKRQDEANFPVKVKITVPEGGFGNQLNDIHAWLSENLPRSDYAYHSDGRNGTGQVTAYYFRETEVAGHFVAALGLKLADGTQIEMPRPTLPSQ